jgi:hypothetical protein
MIAFTLVWRIGGVQPLTPSRSEIDLLRHASALRPIAYDFGARRFGPSSEALSRTRVRSNGERPRAPKELLSALAIPAGTYQIHVTSAAPAEGILTLRIGDTSLPYWTASASRAQLHSSAVPIRIPIDVRSLVVEGDAAAIRSVSSVELEPIPSVNATAPGVAASAHRGVHYPSSDVFFLDENAYPEPTGFWVAGARTTRVVTVSTGFDVFLRNAPVDNTVTIEVDGERHDVALGPGEERTIALPRTRPGPYASVRLTSGSGFRPSEQDPGNRDLRYLGCWVESR